MARYSDVVEYREKVVEIAFRDGSKEINSSVAYVRGYRVCVDGCWTIASCQFCSDEEFNELKNLVERKSRTIRGKCPGLADAELFRGRVEIGVSISSVNFEDVLDVVESLCSEAYALGAEKCEFILLLRETERRILHESGEEASELKRIVDMTTALTAKSSYGGYAFAASNKTMVLWSSRIESKIIDEMFRETMEKLRKSSTAKPLSPIYAGRAQLVLDPIAATGFIHELSHLLDASYSYAYRRVGVQIGPPEMVLVDDPHNIYYPSARFFDDESVKTFKRTLIEDGRIIDLHHTRTTAYIMKSQPGSAHGLFRTPTPFHSVLMLKEGDWRHREIIEETRRGFYVEGLAMATLEGGYIRIIPEIVFRIEEGELKEVVSIRSVKIPLNRIKTISAIGRESRYRSSYEKDHLVTEVAPTIRIEGYIE